MTFAEFLATLWRRRLTIAICAVVAVVAALGYTKVQTPSYRVLSAGSDQCAQFDQPVGHRGDPS